MRWIIYSHTPPLFLILLLLFAAGVTPHACDARAEDLPENTLELTLLPGAKSVTTGTGESASVWATAPRQPVRSLRIGVMAPATGSSAAIGRAQNDTIRKALDIVTTVRSSDGDIQLVPIFREYQTGTCVSVARELVERYEVLAIVGPVDTDCASQVIEAGLQTPIVSPLASASALTDRRDAWFFRTAIPDRVRLTQALNVKRDTGAWPPTSAIVVWDESSAFAKGLTADLEQLLLAENIAVRSLTWTETGWADEVSSVSSSTAKSLTELPSGLSEVFVFGNPIRSARVASWLKSVLAVATAGKVEPRFTIIGDAPELAKLAPTETLAIGEATLDVRSPLPGDGVPFGNRRPAAGEHAQFVLAAYETIRFVLTSAIDEAFRENGATASIQRLRSSVKDVLNTPGRCFDSLQPPRQLCFDKGNLATAPAVPVYRVDTTLTRIDPVESLQWVDIVVPNEVALWEEPLRIRLTGHGFRDGDRVHVFAYHDGESWRARSIAFTGGVADWVVHPLTSGEYTFRTDVRFAPVQPTTVVSLGGAYIVATIAAGITTIVAIGALGGALLWRMLQGIAAAWILTGLTIYARSMVQSFPIPSFSPDNDVNAAIAGVMGAALGPQLIAWIVAFAKRRTAPPGDHV